MPLPLIVWGVAAAAAAVAGAVVVASNIEDDYSSESRKAEREIEARAEQKRKDAELHQSRNYSHKQLKSLINKYSLPCSQDTRRLDKLIDQIIEEEKKASRFMNVYSHVPINSMIAGGFGWFSDDAAESQNDEADIETEMLVHYKKSDTIFSDDAAESRNDEADIETEMLVHYKKSDTICELDKKIKNEQALLQKLNAAEKYLKTIGGPDD
jgi:hypothetical protein